RRFGIAARERVEDSLVSVEGRVGALVGLAPRFARRPEHVPDHREHRREEIVVRGIADDLVEARVLFDVRLAGRDLPFLFGQDPAQLPELVVADALGGQRRERGLDDAAHLDDVAHRVAARDEALQRLHQVVRADLADEGAAAGPRLDDPEELERPQRFPHRGARDLELLRERALRWQMVARMELAPLQELLDLLDDPLVELAAPDRLDYGQARSLRSLSRGPCPSLR